MKVGIFVNTIILKINEDTIDRELLKEAAQVLKHGGLVAFPTETVYGLGADGLDEEAAKKIYEAKGRPSDNPLILHIAEVDSLYELASEVPEKAIQLANVFWPGPLTMVLNKSDQVPYGTTGGLETVAIRMPNHKIALELIREAGVYVAAPSANTSGRPSPTSAEHVAEDMNGRIDLIVDGGEVGIGIESTIIDLTSDIPVILRPGYITKAMLEEVVGEVTIDSAILAHNQDKNLKPKAPGMKYKHYAPKGDLTILEGDINKVIEQINQLARDGVNAGHKVGILATEETKDKYECGIVRTVGTRSNEISIAQGLYRVLREFDQLGTELIYAESFMGDELGQAIMNRLLKAAGYHMIHVDEYKSY